MFAEKLRQILSCIGASPTELARSMGIDPSNISRMLTGKRIPKNGGEGACNLVNGIYFFADERGKIAGLCALISCEAADSADIVKTHMMAWLYNGMNETPKKQGAPKETIPYRTFGEKLNAVMELAELSNVRFGKLINVDTSYVSRFRSGLRSPKSNPKTTDAVCTVLLNRLYEQKKIKQLGAIMKLSPESLKDTDEAFTRFRNWLFDADEADNSPIVEKLIENIDAFSLDAKMPLPLFAEAVDNISEDAVYFGMTGLQNAVVRFLGTAIRSNAKELLLYSDQNIDWMIDPPFRINWAALMLRCVKQGIHICIIHTIDRDLTEMIDAITNWLPLYMSGMIESYYSKRQKNARFSNTLFLCPGVACISGNNVIGQEMQHGIYRYDTEKAMLEAHRMSFEGLLTESKHLVRIYGNVEDETTALMGSGGMTVLGTTLSLATMPQETLLAILARTRADDAVKDAVFSVWKNRRELFEANLGKGFVHECIPTAEDEKLFGGEVLTDIPGLTVNYTPQEYAEHIRGIIALSEAHTNYRFYALPDALFENTKIVLSGGTVAVSRLKAPQVTFMISHPAMCEAFTAYADRIKVQYKQDKISTRRMLERYL